MKVEYFNHKNINEISDVLCESFFEYPAMKYILGEDENYSVRLRKLITFYVNARALRNEPMIGITNEENKIVAAALVTLPEDIPNPIELLERFMTLWQELGEQAQARFTKYETCVLSFFPEEPHHHLNMIGVRKAYQRKGLGRIMMSSIEELVSNHPQSIGLSLNTEDESNIHFYNKLGYKQIAEANLDNSILTRGFFKRSN